MKFTRFFNRIAARYGHILISEEKLRRIRSTFVAKLDKQRGISAQLRRQMAETRTDLTARLGKERSEREALAAETAKLRKMHGATAAELGKVRGERNVLAAQRERLKKARASLAIKAARLGRARDRFATQAADLAAARDALASEARDLAAARDALASEVRELATARDALAADAERLQEDLNQQRRRMEVYRAETATQRSEAERERARLTVSLRAAEEQLAEATLARQELQGRLAVAATERDSLQGEMARMRRDAEEHTREAAHHRQLQIDFETQRRQLEAIQAEHAAANLREAELLQEIGAKRALLEAAGRNREELLEMAARQQDELQAALRSVSATVTRLQEETASLRSELEAERRQFAEATAEGADLRARLAAAEAARHDLESWRKHLKTTLATVTADRDRLASEKTQGADLHRIHKTQDALLKQIEKTREELGRQMQPASASDEVQKLKSVLEEKDARIDKLEFRNKEASAFRAAAERSFKELMDVSIARAQTADDVVPRRLPLVLISQVQRSGGTLLSQLFDGHPELLVHPGELKIGRPNKWNWPTLDMSLTPEDWLRELFEQQTLTYLVEGYSKYDGNPYARADRREFWFSLRTFCDTFLSATKAVRTQRDALDAYMSAYFAAWENGPSSGEEKWVVGFCPRLLMHQDSVAGLLRDYPDGHIVSCVRDPVSWYASSARHDSEYHDIEKAIYLWTASTEASLAQLESRPGQVTLVTYDDLVTDTEGTMRALASRLAISFSDTLLQPTYARRPVRPNSSFAISTAGVHKQSIDQRDLLTPAQLSFVEARATPLYRHAVERIRAAAGR